MQIIVPMSGFGERFRRAGYTVPKPLIEIDGKPIIAHVIEMFPGEEDFIFICNQEHLDNPQYHMQDIIRKYCPTGRVVGIPSHKLGPIHAVRQVGEIIDLESPVVVNYCDFTCYWDWSHFKGFVAECACDGAIPAYKGFHPHTLGTTNYAYMREQDGWVLDIQEKQPYTDNRMEEYASSGTYYFSSGKLMLDAFRCTMEEGINVGGEFYVSLAYKPLLAASKAIAVYPLQHFMQWGTPADVEEYNGWSRVFQILNSAPPAPLHKKGAVVVPMAGLGQRFAREGYSITKPLIPVSGMPMVLQAAHDLPVASAYAFVLRDDMEGKSDVIAAITSRYPGAVIKTVPEVTEGQACSARLGLEALQAIHQDVPGMVTFGACDNGSLYDQVAWSALAADPDIDVIVWGARGHSNAVKNPTMFGWIVADENGNIEHISVKTPLDNPARDPIVIGTFSFRNSEDFYRCVDRLLKRDGRINGELYLDSCINDALALGLRCRLFEVDSFISWGTPNDLRTFEYWQSCFHKWHGHPYRLENDSMIPSSALEQLVSRYSRTLPVLPGV